MSAATSTLTEFLLARIAEDEAHGGEHLAPDDGWAGEHYTWVSQLSGTYGVGVPVSRVAAECAAKRSLVLWADATVRNLPAAVRKDWDDAEAAAAGHAVALLGMAYADHPDYRDEWRP